MINNAVIIGSGNVATHLSLALKDAGVRIVCVYSPNEANAALLAKKLDTTYTCNIRDINSDADICIFSVKDSALQDVIAGMKPSGAIWVHTAGGVDMDVFKDKTDNYGVLYPLQTLSKERTVDFSKVPLLIEGSNKNTLKEIARLAERLSENVNEADSAQRKRLHLAAVFASNFTNHLYDIAAETLKTANLPFSILLPLIEETAAKVKAMPPRTAQTGPAVRYDKNVMNSHLSLIKDDDIKNIYSALSDSIHKFSQIKEQKKN